MDKHLVFILLGIVGFHPFASGSSIYPQCSQTFDPSQQQQLDNYRQNCSNNLGGTVSPGSTESKLSVTCQTQYFNKLTPTDCTNMLTDQISFKNYQEQDAQRLSFFKSGDGDSAIEANLVPGLKECIENSKKADGFTCNPRQSPEVQAAMGIGATITQQLGTMAVGTGVEKTCQDMISTAELAAGALNGLIAACTLATQGCSEDCKNAGSNLDKLEASPAPNYKAVLPSLKSAYTRATKSCDDSGAALVIALNAATQIGGLIMTGQQCKGLTNANQFCQQNPSLSACASLNAQVNCADPTSAATNQVCICRSNPQSNGCSSASSFANAATGQPSSGALGASGAAGARVSSADAAAQLAGLPDPGAFNNGFNNAPPPGAAGGGRGGGGGGFGGGLGGGGGGAGGGDPSKSARNGGGGSGPGWNANVFSGFTGPGAGGPAGGGRGGTNANVYAGTEKPNQLDLKSFLPGGANDPKRSPAGAMDGITSQNTDIWKKLNTRYWSISPNMRP